MAGGGFFAGLGALYAGTKLQEVASKKHKKSKGKKSRSKSNSINRTIQKYI